ncbi:50S ribosomal protein L15 [Phycisphaerae bacterium RAS2]|nr:50S ribosomal protein L15 [Phycisphaerae bacterium RAS2]
MNITEITKKAGAKPPRRRVGRGEGSGWGKTAGYGHKGQNARAGGGAKRGLLSEGGVFPLFRRIPKVGFNNKNFTARYQVVNVSDLDKRFDNGAHVTAATLWEAGLIRDAKAPVKVLGDGAIAKKLTVEAERFSADAAKKIESAGGKVTRLGPQPKKKFVKRPAAAAKKASPEGESGDAKPAKEAKGKEAKGKGAPQGEGGESA